MMNGISSKVGIGAAAGALTSVLVYILQAGFGIVIPGDTAAAITTIIIFATGFFVKETATVDLTDVTVKSVVSSEVPKDATL